jgi:D-alanyl-D-alanine carboxypeptidase/D-alanyl-D-alanine-endopeptidase (penicillin-binding protein 4)
VTALDAHLASPRGADESGVVMKVVTATRRSTCWVPRSRSARISFVKGELKGGVSKGDLAIRGGGDPKLTYERLWQAAHQLRSARMCARSAATSIVDRGFFAPMAHEPGASTTSRAARTTCGPTAARELQRDHVPVRARADGGACIAEPDLPNVQIASRLRATRRAVRIVAPRPALRDRGERPRWRSWCSAARIPPTAASAAWPLALSTAALLRVRMALGVERGGRRAARQGAHGTVPDGARLVYRHESEPLAALCARHEQASNNVMARHLFLTLSAGARNAGEMARACLVRRLAAAQGASTRAGS